MKDQHTAGADLENRARLRIAADTLALHAHLESTEAADFDAPAALERPFDEVKNDFYGLGSCLFGKPCPGTDDIHQIYFCHFSLFALDFIHRSY